MKDGRVGIVAFVGDQVVEGVLGVGILCRHKNVSGSGEAEQTGIAPVFLVGFGRYGEQHHRDSVTLVVISETACVEAIASGIPAVAEPRFIGNRSPSRNHCRKVSYCILVLLILWEELDHDVVVLGKVVHVGLHNPSKDDAVAVVQGGERTDELVGCDLVFHQPEFQLKADVPFHCQAVCKDIHPVLLLPESQCACCQYQVGSESSGRQHPGHGREHVKFQSEEPLHRWHEDLDEQRNGHQQEGDHHVDDQAEEIQVVEFVKL